MKKKLTLFGLPVLACLFLAACSKSRDGEAIHKKKAQEFIAEVSSSRYRVVNFYSDQPIDYNESDNIVKSETDLRAYIKPYLLDDIDEFDNAGNLSITQGETKFPGNDSAVLYRKFGVSWDNSYTFINFVDYYYIPNQYRLHEFTSTGFTIYLNWHTGAKIYTVFSKLN